MPMGPYSSWDDCIQKNKNKVDNVDAYCGKIKSTIEKEEKFSRIDSNKIEETLKLLEEIDKNKENGTITQEQHDEQSKKVLEDMENSGVVQSPIKKAMHSRVGKKRVIMTRADGIKQHYFMNPEEIKAYRAKGRDVQEIGEGEAEKQKTIAVDFDGTIVTLENPDVLQVGAKEGLQALADMGYRIVIFSGRNTKDIEGRMAKLGVDTYDYINDNPEERQDNPGKPVADYYLDDRAVKFTNWNDAVSKLKGGIQKQEEEEDPTDTQEDMAGNVAHSKKMKDNLHRQSQEELNEETEEIPQKAETVQKGQRASNLQMKGYAERLANKEKKKPEEVKKNNEAVEDYPYLEAHLKDAASILDKCPKTKDLSREQKIQILQDTIGKLNPIIKEDMMTEIRKDMDSPVAPAAPAPKDPIAELKEMIAMLVQKVGAIEAKVGGGPAQTEEVAGEEVEKGKPGLGPSSGGQFTPGNKPQPKAIRDINPNLDRDDYAGAVRGPVEKAEPVKTVKMPASQKEQADKELGPDKVSGAQYLNKEDAAALVEMAVASAIKKMGFTQTPKMNEAVAHPLEKMEGTPKDAITMASLATMKFDKVHSIAENLMGGARV